MHQTAMLLSVVQHTLVIYTFLVLALATIGRQQMGQWTLFDFVIIALLGSSVETGLYLGTGSFWAGLLSALTLLTANHVVRLLSQRVPFMRRFIVGSPILVVHHGAILAGNLRRAHLTEQELLTALRSRGYADLAVVRYAVAEANGLVGVVPEDGSQVGDARDA